MVAKKDYSHTGAFAVPTARSQRHSKAELDSAPVVELSVHAQEQLRRIMRQREKLETELSDLDEKVYDLESDYLKTCVELGGSLFDGFGSNSRSVCTRSGMRIVTPRSVATAAGGVGGSSSNGTAKPAVTCVTSLNETSRMAFAARLHSFTPSERIFSAASFGALSRVEERKAEREQLLQRRCVKRKAGSAKKSRR